MPDIADDRAAYLEAMRRAEAASGIERDAEGNEINGIEAFMRGETPVATPELEGAVPVSASDQPLTPEPETPVVEDTSEQQPEALAAELSVDDLRQRLATAEALLAEKDFFIGRQSGEVGELRQAITEMQQQLASVQTQPVAPQVPLAPVTQADIDNDPAEAAQRALKLRDESALHRAFEVWKEIDPFTAATWLADRKLEQQRAEFDAQLAETKQQIETATAPLAESAAESANQRQWAEAFNEVKATRPDFMENAERILSEVAPKYPDFTEMLANGDAKAKAAALSALYALDKMGDPQAVQAQLAEAAHEAAAEAAAARAAAGVVTGQSTAGQPTEQKTQEELEQEAYAARQRSKPSLARGFTRG